MPFSGSTFTHLKDWELEAPRQEKIYNASLEAEFDGIDTALSSRLARAGTSTNDNAAAGDIGEFISSTIASGSAVSLTTATATNVTSISLTAGDWDVSGAGFTNPSLGNATAVLVGISLTSATLPSFNAGDTNYHAMVTTATDISTTVLPVGPWRVSVGSTTTVYLVGSVTFGSGTASMHGTLRARRVR